MMTVVTSPGFMRTVSFQPSSVRSGPLRGPGVAGRAVVGVHVERLASRALDVDQVEVDRVGVAGQVGDLPDLGWCRRRRLGGRVHRRRARSRHCSRLVRAQQLDQAAESHRRSRSASAAAPARPAASAATPFGPPCPAARGTGRDPDVRSVTAVMQGRVLAGRRDDLEAHDLARVRPEAGLGLRRVARLPGK